MMSALAGGGGGGRDYSALFAIQYTYILNVQKKSTGYSLVCDYTIRVPTAEPKINNQAVLAEQPFKIVPCVELIIPHGLSLIFETNEGITVLPIRINSGQASPTENPYLPYRYVLVLPRNCTGIKSCSAWDTYDGTTVSFPNNLTFDIMPPPYNYDSALYGVISSEVKENAERISALENEQLYVKQGDVSLNPGFFRLIGAGEDSNVLGWNFTFSNSGKDLTLTYGAIANPNIIFSGIDITDCKLLHLTYDRPSSVFNLYTITQGITGKYTAQRLLASGCWKTIRGSQQLHLLIDGSEQNVNEIASGFVSFI